MEQSHSTTSKRKWKQLTEKDRYHLEACFNAGMKTQEIAERMGYFKRIIEVFACRKSVFCLLYKGWP